MGAVTERTCLLFYTASLFDWSFCELVCSVHENTAWTNRHWAIIPIWNYLNACFVISVCHLWVSRRWIWRTDLSFGLWRRVVLSYFPLPYTRPHMCINRMSQGYRIASRPQWRHSVTLNFLNGITSGKTYTCQNCKCNSKHLQLCVRVVADGLTMSAGSSSNMRGVFPVHFLHTEACLLWWWRWGRGTGHTHVHVCMCVCIP